MFDQAGKTGDVVADMMSKREFEARLTEIEEQAAADQERVDGRRDQAMAKLFIETEWSQEELASLLSEKWGKEVSQSWMRDHLRFGRFLSFFSSSATKDDWMLPVNLTVTAFTRFWNDTPASGDFRGHKANTTAAKQDEQRRFALVIEALKSSGLRRKQKPIRKAIIGLPESKHWHTAAEIAAELTDTLGGTVQADDVGTAFRHWSVSVNNPYRVEKSGTGPEAKYRVVKVKGTVVSRKQVAAWAPELIPLMEQLIREARKDRVEVSMTALCDLANKVKKIMEGMTATVTEDG